ncbi:MAG: hypothetical protein EXQ89_05890 [Rhodospirillaceae bacterium]|nr:hypothetical protein [Rhodospirillaceae bacterium]
MQFLLIAHDGTDAGAAERRRVARTAHLDGIARLKEAGNFIAGGAILDESGGMIGSACLLDFPSRDALDSWLKADPYTVGDVWREVEIRPFRLAALP